MADIIIDLHGTIFVFSAEIRLIRVNNIIIRARGHDINIGTSRGPDLRDAIGETRHDAGRRGIGHGRGGTRPRAGLESAAELLVVVVGGKRE